MGLNQGGGSKTYLKISAGKIAKRCAQTDPGAIACSNKDGTNKWFEQRFTSVSGMLKDVYQRTTEWGTDLCIDIVDAGETFQLQMPLDSRYSFGFFKCMPNIDVTKKITFTPWMKEVVAEGGKTVKKTALYLSYGPAKEDQIEWYWTKDMPNGLPPMEQIKNKKGQLEWSSWEQLNYLLDHLQHTFLPKLKEVAPLSDPQGRSAAADFALPEEEEHGHQSSSDDDSLPF